MHSTWCQWVCGHGPFDALTKANTFDLLAFGSERAFFDTATRNRKAYSGWKWKKKRILLTTLTTSTDRSLTGHAAATEPQECPGLLDVRACQSNHLNLIWFPLWVPFSWHGWKVQQPGCIIITSQLQQRGISLFKANQTSSRNWGFPLFDEIFKLWSLDGSRFVSVIVC